MASSVVPSGSSFYMASVSKGLIGYLFVSTCALHAPALNGIRSAVVYSLHDVIRGRNYWRLLSSKMAFLDIKDLICSCLLLYYFRVFERRMGSHKYCSHLINSLLLSSLVEVALILSVEYYSGVTINFLPSGPLAMIFALFVNYFTDIPSSHPANVLGIPFSSKVLSYFLAFQIIAGSRGSLVSATAGIISGMILRCLPPVSLIPKPVAKFFSWAFSFFESEAPDEGPFLLGATIEIQREQQMELLEQQMMMSSMEEVVRNNRQFNFQRHSSSSSLPRSSSGMNVLTRDRNRSPAPFVLPPSASSSPGPSSPNDSRGSSISSSSRDLINERRQNEAPDEESIQTLVEMGFERNQVIDALKKSNNDVNRATCILIE